MFTVHLGAPDFSNDIYIWCSCERVNPLNTDSENIVVPNIANILLSWSTWQQKILMAVLHSDVMVDADHNWNYPIRNEVYMESTQGTYSLPLNSGAPIRSSARIHPIDQTSTSNIQALVQSLCKKGLLLTCCVVFSAGLSSDTVEMDYSIKILTCMPAWFQVPGTTGLRHIPSSGKHSRPAWHQNPYSSQNRKF